MRPASLIGADAMMAIGVLPLVLWLVFVTLVNFGIGAPGFDFTMGVLALTFGLLAYAIALIVGGGGAIWAVVAARRRAITSSPMVVATVVILSIPFAVMLASYVWRAVAP